MYTKMTHLFLNTYEMLVQMTVTHGIMAIFLFPKRKSYRACLKALPGTEMST